MFASTQQKAAKYINHAYVVLVQGGQKKGQVEVEWTDYYTEFKIFGLGDASKLYADYKLNLHEGDSCDGAISDIKLDPLFQEVKNGKKTLSVDKTEKNDLIGKFIGLQSYLDGADIGCGQLQFHPHGVILANQE